MMFKNLCIYRLPAPFMTGSLGLSSFEEDVSGNALRACAASDDLSGCAEYDLAILRNSIPAWANVPEGA